MIFGVFVFFCFSFPLWYSSCVSPLGRVSSLNAVSDLPTQSLCYLKYLFYLLSYIYSEKTGLISVETGLIRQKTGLISVETGLIS